MESCSSDACLALTQHVIPIMYDTFYNYRGILTSIGIALSSWTAIQEIIKTQNLGNFDSVPNAMLFINSFSWFLYGIFVKKPYVTFPNVIGVQFMLYYIMSTYHLHSPDKRKLIRNIFMGGFMIVMSIGMIAFIGIYDTDRVPTQEDLNHSKNLLGVSSVLILMVFYSSPLANLVQVIRKKDASSLNLSLAIASGINGALWTTYGFAIADPFVFLPNFLGIVSSVIQILVKLSMKSNQEPTASTYHVLKEDISTSEAFTMKAVSLETTDP